MRKVNVLLAILAAFCFSPNSEATAARPFLSAESATPIDRGQSRVDAGYTYDRFSSQDLRHVLLMELTHGLLNDLDFEVEIPVLFNEAGEQDDSGLGDLAIKSKVRFIKGREANPLSIAGQLGFKFPTCNENKSALVFLNSTCTGEVDVSLRAIASKVFSPVTVHLNLEYTLVGDPPGRDLDDIFTYDLAFESRTPIERLGVIAELFGQINQNINVSGQNPLLVRLGLVYALLQNFYTDGVLGVGLTEGGPDYALSAGFSYHF